MKLITIVSIVAAVAVAAPIINNEFVVRQSGSNEVVKQLQELQQQLMAMNGEDVEPQSPLQMQNPMENQMQSGGGEKMIRRQDDGESASAVQQQLAQMYELSQAAMMQVIMQAEQQMQTGGGKRMSRRQQGSGDSSNAAQFNAMLAQYNELQQQTMMENMEMQKAQAFWNPLEGGGKRMSRRQGGSDLSDQGSGQGSDGLAGQPSPSGPSSDGGSDPSTFNTMVGQYNELQQQTMLENLEMQKAQAFWNPLESSAGGGGKRKSRRQQSSNASDQGPDQGSNNSSGQDSQSGSSSGEGSEAPYDAQFAAGLAQLDALNNQNFYRGQQMQQEQAENSVPNDDWWGTSGQ